MNVLSKKQRLKSFLSGLLCVGILLSQTPMVFAADTDGADEPAAVTVEAELTTATPAADELQTPQTEVPLEDPQTVASQAAEESAALLSLALEDGKVSISTAQDLADLAAAVNAGEDGYGAALTVTLTDNIDLSELSAWTPIGTAEHPFTGEFNGGEKTISGLTITDPETGNQALFGVVSGEAYIHTLTVEGSVTVTAPNDETTTLNNNAGVIGSIDGNATDVLVDGVTSKVTVNGGRSVGGIVGLIAEGAVATLADCVNAGSVTATPGTNAVSGVNIGVGGIAGTVLSADAEMTSCDNTGAVTNMSAGTGAQGTGGIVGYCAGTVEDCANTGAVTGIDVYYVGGIVGWLLAGGTISGCTNGSADDETAGTISGGVGQGGIAAYADGSVSGCTNYGAVTSTTGSGVIYGSGGVVGNNGASGTVSDSINYGDVKVTVSNEDRTSVGGVVGTVSGTVTDCENCGNVVTQGWADTACGTGGVAGYIYAGGLVYNSSNNGNVMVNDTDTWSYKGRYVGGVVGYMAAGSEAQFSSNTGDVSRGGIIDTCSPGVAGVAGYVAGTLHNCWSTGMVTYSGRVVPAAATGGASGIACIAADGGVVQDCYATGKINLTYDSKVAGTAYASAIGVQYATGIVRNCFYYCADYEETESAYIQPMRVQMAANVANCFVRTGEQYTCVDDSTYTLDAEIFASESGVLAKLGKLWKLADESAAYPTLLSEDETQGLFFTLAVGQVEVPDTAGEEVTTALFKDGGTLPSGSWLEKDDVITLIITVPEDTTERLLMVYASDSTRLSGASVEGSTYTYTITMGEADLEIRYAWVNTETDPTAWYCADPEASEFIITQPEQLAFLSQLSVGTARDTAGNALNADTFDGKTVRLAADLDLSSLCHPADQENGIQEVSWTPITFYGTFDGGVYEDVITGEGENAVTTSVLTGSHTIKNLYVNRTVNYAALFGTGKSASYAIVRNLTLEDAQVISTGSYTGAIVGRYGIAVNCTVRDSAISGVKYVGGLVGYQAAAMNCTVENTTVAATGNYAGGMIGSYSSTPSGYDVSGNKTVNTTVISTGNYVGGIVGSAGGAVSMCQVLGGSVTGGSYVGGIGVGTINGAIVTATVMGSGDYVGGISGFGAVTSAIYYCYDAETGLGISTSDETAAHVGPLSGSAQVTSGGGQNTTTFIAPFTNCLYLSNVNSQDADGAYSLTAEGFLLDEALYLLQGGGIYWELKEGAQYPTFKDTAGDTLYKLTIQPLGKTDSENAVSITPFVEGGEGYSYRLYGTEGGEQWTYATENTVIPLTVTIMDGWQSGFYPSDVVTVTPSETEDGAAAYAVTLTADTTLEYDFAKIVSPDTSWYDDANPQTGYTIEDEGDLRGLAQLVNEGNDFAGVSLTLTNNLVLEGGNWTPIGDSAEHPFSGSFVGGDHTIDGLYIYGYSVGDYAGLFGFLSDQAQVSGLIVNGSVDAGSKYTGGVAGWSAGTLTDITSGVSVTVTGHGADVSDTGYVGGIVGYLAAGAHLDGALFTGTVTVGADGNSSNTSNSDGSGSTLPSYVYMGGLAGGSYGMIAYGENRGQLSTANRYGVYYAGGIVGYNLGTVTDCRNTADLSGVTAACFGGVVGFTGSGSVITRSGNDGDLTVEVMSTSSSLGGLVGRAQRSVISQTYNRGDITNKATTKSNSSSSVYVGGLVGWLYVANAASGTRLGYSYNTGNAAFAGTQGTGTDSIYVGGLVGASTGGYLVNTTVNIIYNCYNTVTGSTAEATLKSLVNVSAGGLLGKGSVTVSNCYTLSTVTEIIGVSTTKLTETSLKAAASKLGIPFTADTVDDASINGGYPVLHWEVDDPSQGVTLNYHDSDLYTLSTGAGLSLVSYYEPDIIVVLSPEEARTAIEAEVSVPDGFDFRGWYADKTDEGTKYDPEITVLAAGDSYERYWDLEKVTVTLDYGYSDVDGNPVIDTVHVLKDATMEKPAVPTREGNDFLGWYTAAEDENGNVVYNAFDFSTILTADITLYARWQELTADTDWYKDEESSFTITTVEQLFGLAQLVNGGTSFAGKTVTLGGDLDLTGLEFHAIGTDTGNAFSGTFDGANHTISNLIINQGTENNQALFGCVSGAVIKNLVVSGEVMGSSYVAGLVACASGALTLENCGSEVTVAATGSYAGGLLGYADSSETVTITSCYNAGSVSTSSTSGAPTENGGIGGLAGYFNAPATIQNSYNLGVISGNQYAAGGIVGYTNNNSTVKSLTISNCYNAGTVTSAGTYSGAIVGYLSAAAVECTNSYYLDASCAYAVQNAASVTGINSVTAAELAALTAALNGVNGTQWVDTDAQIIIAGGHSVVKVDGEPVTAATLKSYPALSWENTPTRDFGSLTFTVTPDSGYTLVSVSQDDQILAADENGVYTLNVTGGLTVTVSVKRTSWSASSPASADIEKIVDSVAGNTQAQDAADSTYDDTLDYNDDGLNDLLDILDILYRQKAQETQTPPAEESPVEEPPVQEQNNVAEENV